LLLNVQRYPQILLAVHDERPRRHLLGMKARSEIGLLIRRGGGLISRRDHPSLANTMAWLVRQGKLVPVLPGIYAAPEIARTADVLCVP